jgi:hypothetical protein
VRVLEDLRGVLTLVVPAKAGIHWLFQAEAKMDPGFRRDDGVGSGQAVIRLDRAEAFDRIRSFRRVRRYR